MTEKLDIMILGINFALLHDRFRKSLVDLGVRDERVTVIRNWSHVAPSTGNRERTRAALGWAPDETVVLHAGNMGHKQGLENVVEAARLADREKAPVRFVLLGGGARRRALEEMAADVQRLDFVDPLPDEQFEDAMAAADVLLLNEKPGVADMCVPGKLTSYFAAGRPVAAVTDPRSGGASEVLAAGAGVLVASGDPYLLLKTVQALRDDPVQCAELGARGKAYAEAFLSPEAALRAYADWASELVRAKRGPGPDKPLARVSSGYDGR